MKREMEDTQSRNHAPLIVTCICNINSFKKKGGYLFELTFQMILSRRHEKKGSSIGRSSNSIYDKKAK